MTPAGAGQLVLLLVVILAPYILCYLPCCLACCIDKDDMKGKHCVLLEWCHSYTYLQCKISLCFFLILHSTGSIPFVVVTLIVTILIVLASLAISAWWIADLVIFAKNDRLSGNGCMLSPTL